MQDDFLIGKDWLVQPRLNRVISASKSVRLPPKYMHVLVCLAERPGQPLSREELMEAVWKDTIVVEESLTRAISELRKVFDDDSKHAKFIETIPKTGYRLIAPVKHGFLPPADHGARSDHTGLAAPTSPSEGRSNVSATTLARLFSQPVFVVMATVILFAVAWARWDWLFPPKEHEVTQPIRTLPLTSYQGVERQPALSPDGRHLAFVWNGGAGQSEGIYFKEVGSNHSTLLVESASDPAWSPEGRSLAFVLHSTAGCTIFKISPANGLTQKLLEIEREAHPFNPAWSPDGRWLAYSLQRHGQDLLYILSLETQESKPLSGSLSRGIHDREPAFSPDGKSLAFLRVAFGKTEVHTIPVSGGEAIRLVHGEHRISDIEWTPDGRAVILATQEGLWKLRLPDGKEELLAAATTSIDHISISRTSWRLAYEQASEDKNIWQLDLALQRQGKARPSQLVGSSRADTQPAISPDGKRIAFVSDRSGQSQIWKGDWHGTGVTPLTSFQGCGVTSPSWSPDGRLIAFAANPEGQFDLYMVAATGGEPVRLTTTVTHEETPAWSRDGHWIYFSSNEDGCRQIRKISVADRQIISISPAAGNRAIESHDGQWLYYSIVNGDSTEFWRRPVAGGAAELALAVPGGIGEDWKVNVDGIYFARYDERCHLVFGFFDFGSAQISTLFNTPRSSLHFDVSADGRTLVFDQFDRSEGDIMLLENFR